MSHDAELNALEDEVAQEEAAPEQQEEKPEVPNYLVTAASAAKSAVDAVVSSSMPSAPRTVPAPSAPAPQPGPARQVNVADVKQS